MQGRTPAEVFVRCLPKPKRPKEENEKSRLNSTREVKILMRLPNGRNVAPRQAVHGSAPILPVTISPNRKIFEARKRETAALGAGEKLVLGHPLAATIGDSARCMQNLEKVLFTGPKTSDTVTFICD